MRVLFLAPANSIHTVKWVNAITKKGNQVFLISQHTPDKGIDKAVKIIILPFKGMVGYYLNAVHMRTAYKQIRPDVINVHYASGYGTLARVAHLPKVILSVWGSDVYEFPYENSLKNIILKKNLKAARIITSTSNAMAKQVEKLIGDTKVTKVIPFGINLTHFKMKSFEDKEEFVFCVVKTLSYLYGIDIIIYAYKELLNYIERSAIEKKQNICLEIYGVGKETANLKDLCAKLRIEENVSFNGYIDNSKLPEVFQNVEVFCMGSRRESFGVAILEAMACGIPVIATETDGAKEVMVNNETGFLAEQESVSQIAQYMIKLYQDGALRKNMGKSGREWVEKYFNWDDNVREMIKVYNEVKNSGRY